MGFSNLSPRFTPWCICSWKKMRFESLPASGSCSCCSFCCCCCADRQSSSYSSSSSSSSPRDRFWAGILSNLSNSCKPKQTKAKERKGYVCVNKYIERRRWVFSSMCWCWRYREGKMRALEDKEGFEGKRRIEEGEGWRVSASSLRCYCRGIVCVSVVCKTEVEESTCIYLFSPCPSHAFCSRAFLSFWSTAFVFIWKFVLFILLDVVLIFSFWNVGWVFMRTIFINLYVICLKSV